MGEIEEWFALLLLFVFIGIPAFVFQLLVRPVATLKWIKQGGGGPSPAKIEYNMNSGESE